MKWFLIVLAIGITIARPLFIVHEFNRHITMSYQAIAHLLVAGLLGWSIGRFVLKEQAATSNTIEATRLDRYIREDTWMGVTASIMITMEIVCAVVTVVLKLKG